MWNNDLCTDLFKRSRLFTQIARGNKSLSARNPQTRHRHLLRSRRQHKRLSAFAVKVVEAETFPIPDWVCTNGAIGLCKTDNGCNCWESHFASQHVFVMQCLLSFQIFIFMEMYSSMINGFH